MVHATNSRIFQRYLSFVAFFPSTKNKIDFISAQELILESPLKHLNDNCLFLQFSVSFSSWFAFVFSDEKSKTDETVCNLLGVMYGYLIQGSILIPQYNSWFVCLKKYCFCFDNMIIFFRFWVHIVVTFLKVMLKFSVNSLFPFLRFVYFKLPIKGSEWNWSLNANFAH